MLNLLRNRFATTNSSTLLRSLSSVASRSSVSAFAARQSPAIVGSRSFLTARGSSDDDSNDHRRPKLGSASSSVGSGSENGRQFKRMIEAGEYDEVIDRFESSRHVASDSSTKSYLVALVATGKIWQLNLARFASLLRGGSSTSPSASSYSASSSSASSSYGGSSHSNTSGVSVVTTDPSSPFFVQLLPPKGTRFQSVINFLRGLASLALLVGLALVVSGQVSVGSTPSKGGLPFMKPTHAKAEKSTTKFDDVKGCDEAVEELREVVEYLREPSKFVRLGAKMPRGVLLSGPPGTGKTLLARAIAGEAKVPFYYTTGSSFDEMFVGVGSRRVRDMFADAKVNQPCIIFIDEIDAIGMRRQTGPYNSHRDSLNTLLTEMDGFSQNDGIVVIAATNLPDVLDPALIRPGRFDKQVAVHPPDIKGRTDILDLYMKKTHAGPDVDTATLARGTPGFTGADLANLVNLAAIKASRSGAKAISMAQLEEAKDDVLMGVIRTSAAARMPLAERRMTAYHEGGHALVGYFTPGSDPLHKATVLPRGRSLGATFSLPEGDQHSVSRTQLLAKIAMAMGGRAAEDLIYGSAHVSTGASNDFKQATNIAQNMVARWGMSDTVGFVYHEDPTKVKEVQQEVKTLLDQQYKYALETLKQNEAALHRVAAALLEREQLDGKEIQMLIEGHKLPPLNIVGQFSPKNKPNEEATQSD